MLMSDTWGQRITEYVTVREPRPGGFDRLPPDEFSFAAGPPRDFKVDDVELRLQSPLIRIAQTNSNRDSISVRRVRTEGEVSGTVVWIYLPTRGRYALSILPRPGFQRAGEIRGSSLRFSTVAEEIVVMSGAPIAPGDAAFNLYVQHDPMWKPTYAHANVDAMMVGAADRAEYVMKR